MRTQVSAPGGTDIERLSADFAPVATEFRMTYEFNSDRKARILIMVSKLGHCLNDLIFRWREGSLNADIVAVVSNHEDLRPMAESAGLPFFHIPVTPKKKETAEARLPRLVADYEVERAVRAPSMQILSKRTCRALQGRAITTHHPSLPGFKGAKP